MNRKPVYQHPEGWNAGEWQECWKGEYVDFTVDTWTRKNSEEQSRLAKAYKKWYAEQKGMAEERSISKSGAVFEFTLIPPGKFWRGSPEGEKDKQSGETRHKVRISKAYYMQKTEITQGQWRAVTGESPWSGQSYMENNDRHAAAYISWDDIKQKMLPKMGSEFGLPTEVQWEYACRAGTTTRFYWGESESEMGQYANSGCAEDGYKYIAPVGSLKPNGFGLCDMSGNVWEWCEDKYANYKGEEQVDPCNQEGSDCVYRGGFWNIRKEKKTDQVFVHEKHERHENERIFL